MFCSTFLLLFILVKVAQMSIIAPPDCDEYRLPKSEHLDIERFSGMWYEKTATTILPTYVNLTEFFVNVTFFQTMGPTLFRAHFKRSFSGSNECRENNYNCVLLGSRCYQVEEEQHLYIIVNDYESIAAIWTVTSFGADTYASLALYTRDPHTVPDTSSIRSELVNFCADWAADPTSSNYKIKLSYDNTPCLLG